MPSEEVLKIHSDYLVLQNRNKFDFILKENKEILGPFLKLIKILKEKNIKLHIFITLFNLGNDINKIKSEKEQLEFEIEMLQETKKYWHLEINDIKVKYFKL